MKKLINKNNGKFFGNVGEDTGVNNLKVGDIVEINGTCRVVCYDDELNYYSIYGGFNSELSKLIKNHNVKLKNNHHKLNQDNLSKTSLEELRIVENKEAFKYNIISNKITYNIVYNKTNSIRSLFVGCIENFNPNGSCVFSNNDGEILLIQYEQLIEISKY